MPVCTYCENCLLHKLHIECAECLQTFFCVDCFSAGVCIDAHQNGHAYIVHRSCYETSVFTKDWTILEELKLLDGDIFKYSYNKFIHGVVQALKSLELETGNL